ncbi:MAG: hypothetical protein MJ247_05840 [Alphaproteobacteria bacterium]|nr:hypothetical protein [Alphaproteobacteria bacterium]
MEEKNIDASEFLKNGMMYLRQMFPEITDAMSEKELRNKLIDQAEFILDRGFETQAEVMMIVDLLWRLPEDALENPNFDWLKEILNDKNMNGKEKIHAIQVAAVMRMNAENHIDDAHGEECCCHHEDDEECCCHHEDGEKCHCHHDKKDEDCKKGKKKRSCCHKDK